MKTVDNAGFGLYLGIQRVWSITGFSFPGALGCGLWTYSTSRHLIYFRRKFLQRLACSLAIKIGVFCVKKIFIVSLFLITNYTLKFTFYSSVPQRLPMNLHVFYFFFLMQLSGRLKISIAIYPLDVYTRLFLLICNILK